MDGDGEGKKSWSSSTLGEGPSQAASLRSGVQTESVLIGGSSQDLPCEAYGYPPDLSDDLLYLRMLDLTPQPDPVDWLLDYTPTLDAAAAGNNTAAGPEGGGSIFVMERGDAGAALTEGGNDKEDAAAPEGGNYTLSLVAEEVHNEKTTKDELRRMEFILPSFFQAALDTPLNGFEDHGVNTIKDLWEFLGSRTVMEAFTCPYALAVLDNLQYFKVLSQYPDRPEMGTIVIVSKKGTCRKDGHPWHRPNRTGYTEKNEDVHLGNVNCGKRVATLPGVPNHHRITFFKNGNWDIVLVQYLVCDDLVRAGVIRSTKVDTGVTVTESCNTRQLDETRVLLPKEGSSPIGPRPRVEGTAQLRKELECFKKDSIMHKAKLKGVVAHAEKLINHYCVSSEKAEQLKALRSTAMGDGPADEGPSDIGQSDVGWEDAIRGDLKEIREVADRIESKLDAFSEASKNLQSRITDQIASGTAIDVDDVKKLLSILSCPVR